MSSKSAAMAAIIGIMSCAGCAQTPRLDIAKSGVLPAADSAYSLAEPLDTPASATLSACLATRGIHVAAKPAYLAQLVETDRPGMVGVMGPQPAEGIPAAATWLPGAAPGRRAVRSLTFSLIRASTGETVYRIAVSERYRPRAKRAALADLARIACSSLAG